MKQTFKGWGVGLIDKYNLKLFLGRYKTSEGVWYARMYYNPCEHNVRSCLFKTSEEALDFWKNCYLADFVSKDSFTVIPIHIEYSVEVQGLGFDWNGIT